MRAHVKEGGGILHVLRQYTVCTLFSVTLVWHAFSERAFLYLHLIFSHTAVFLRMNRRNTKACNMSAIPCFRNMRRGHISSARKASQFFFGGIRIACGKKLERRHTHSCRRRTIKQHCLLRHAGNVQTFWPNLQQRLWAKEKPKFDDARKLRGIYSFDPEDPELKENHVNMGQDLAGNSTTTILSI